MTFSIHSKSAESNHREQIVQFGKSLFDRGLTAGSSGNLSVRLDDGWLLTPTNASLGRLDPASLTKLDWNGNTISGLAPSKEAFLHRAMYNTRSGARAIVHLHSTYSAAVSCMCGLNHDSCIPPLTPYFVMKVGRLPLAPYHRPGDPELTAVIEKLALKHSAVLLANHGPIVSANSLEAAVNSAEELEETAKLFLLLKGVEAQALNTKQIEDLKNTFNLEIE
jgi:ribulose-5-phosphate 4-epimerase/fuculose-1-phosphate aldolase